MNLTIYYVLRKNCLKIFENNFAATGKYLCKQPEQTI